jgi:hypothetical protein
MNHSSILHLLLKTYWTRRSKGRDLVLNYSWEGAKEMGIEIEPQTGITHGCLLSTLFKHHMFITVTSHNPNPTYCICEHILRHLWMLIQTVSHPLRTGSSSSYPGSGFCHQYHTVGRWLFSCTALQARLRPRPDR